MSDINVGYGQLSDLVAFSVNLHILLHIWNAIATSIFHRHTYRHTYAHIENYCATKRGLYHSQIASYYDDEKMLNFFITSCQKFSDIYFSYI